MRHAAGAQGRREGEGEEEGTYIVDGHNEDGLVVLQQALQLVEVFLLVGLDPHFFLFVEERIFKVQEGWVWRCGGEGCEQSGTRTTSREFEPIFLSGAGQCVRACVRAGGRAALRKRTAQLGQRPFGVGEWGVAVRWHLGCAGCGSDAAQARGISQRRAAEEDSVPQPCRLLPDRESHPRPHALARAEQLCFRWLAYVAGDVWRSPRPSGSPTDFHVVPAVCVCVCVRACVRIFPPAWSPAIAGWGAFAG